MSATEIAEERTYEEIMAELREESLEDLGVTRQEFAEMSVPEIRRRLHERQESTDSSLVQRLLS